MDAVIHTAALVSVWRKDPADFDRVNVGGLETVIDVCASYGTPRLVVTSSFLALPPPGQSRPLEANPYQRSKVRAREVARMAVGRGLPLVRDHLAGRLPGIIGADRTWAFSFVDDVADAHVRAMEAGQPGADYSAGGENAPQVRAFEILRELTTDRPSTAASHPGLGGVPPGAGRRDQGARRDNSPADSRNRQDSGTRLALGQRTYQQRTQLSDDAPGRRDSGSAGASILRSGSVVSILLRDRQPCKGAARNLHNVSQIERVWPGRLPVLRRRCGRAARDPGRLY
jgi:nucleoside-diphosphate-sugar epimerase